MTTDPPPPASSHRDAFLRELVSALRDAGVEKIDPEAVTKRGNGSGSATMLLVGRSRSRSRPSSTSSTSSTSSSLLLARAAHARLQFDYPSLDAGAVDALSRAVGEQLKLDRSLSTTTTTTIFSLAPTRKLVAALAGDPPSLVSPTEDENEIEGGEIVHEEDRARARALDAAAASAGCWDRLAVSYTVRTVLSVLESLGSSRCSSSSVAAPSSSPSSPSSPPLSPLLLLSRLADELDEEGERAEEDAAKRAAAAAAAGSVGGGEEAERALAAFLGQDKDEDEDEEKEKEKEEEEEEAPPAADSAPAPAPADDDEDDDDDSDYDTPLHPDGAGGGLSSFGEGDDPLFASVVVESHSDDSAAAAAAAAANAALASSLPAPSLPSAVRAMVSLVQAARSRVGQGWAEAGGIELTAACLSAVKRAAAAASASSAASSASDSDSASCPPLRRLGTELLLLARDGAVASPVRGAAALPALLAALGANEDEEKASPSALADAAELFAAVVAGWPLPNSSSGNASSPSSQSRLALARAWRDATATTSRTNLIGSLAAALSSATGGGSLEGAKRALSNDDNESNSSSSSSSPSLLLGAACSALAALLRAAGAAGAPGEEVARGMLGSGAWRSVACLLAAAADGSENENEEGEKDGFLPLPRGALEAAVLGSAHSPELARYLAASPAGKFVVEASKREKSLEGLMLSALFAAAAEQGSSSSSSSYSSSSSPFSSAPLAQVISESYDDDAEQISCSAAAPRWRDAAALLRAMSSVGVGGSGGGRHRWGAEVDAAVARLERALIAASAAASSEEREEEEQEQIVGGVAKRRGPEAAHRREALRLASAERRRAASVPVVSASSSAPSSSTCAPSAAAAVAAAASARGKDD